MKLLIFDIDGTLIQTHEEEANCFIQAFSDVTGISHIDKDLRSYQHVTDSGIAQECIFNHFQRDATFDELEQIEERFITLFAKTLAKQPPHPIAGVHGLFEKLANEPEICLAIATGSYYRSAMIKFHYSSLYLHHLPISSCNDHYSRTEIMRIAKSKAQDFYGVGDFDSITYVGDGPWDIEAVNALTWQFIGVASNYSKKNLLDWGAQTVITDYLEQNNSFVELIRKH
jgi:phosphoglycolate phosphatase-like HAD superfamily hydrolase